MVGVVCALLFYIYKDVTHQVQTIRAQAAADSQAAAKPKQKADSQINCPMSRYEGMEYYSQYYEDFILNYVFADTPKGSYIDIGSAEPKRYNLTHKFYLKGWRGISIDPVPTFKPLYEKERPGDLFLNVGISNEEGTMRFYDCGPACGWSTFDHEGAKKLAKERNFNFKETFKEIDVPVTTMAKVLAEHPQNEIHFVNIDVEGWEKQVLQSFDFQMIKPEVFVVESTAPMSTDSTQHLWEHILLDQNYVLAMTDHLNRYYVHRQSGKLVQHLQRFSFIDMCVQQSKIRRGLIPTSYNDWFGSKPEYCTE